MATRWTSWGVRGRRAWRSLSPTCPRAARAPYPRWERGAATTTRVQTRPSPRPQSCLEPPHLEGRASLWAPSRSTPCATTRSCRNSSALWPPCTTWWRAPGATQWRLACTSSRLCRGSAACSWFLPRTVRVARATSSCLRWRRRVPQSSSASCHPAASSYSTRTGSRGCRRALTTRMRRGTFSGTRASSRRPHGAPTRSSGFTSTSTTSKS
mmetsp:Transcript_15950/g.50108  ORF Transcript_15950/g.50108 Transcript_15950/m.50108 type:complete len:211 (+) Transcript_15950:2454-3086(+)